MRSPERLILVASVGLAAIAIWHWQHVLTAMIHQVEAATLPTGPPVGVKESAAPSRTAKIPAHRPAPSKRQEHAALSFPPELKSGVSIVETPPRFPDSRVPDSEQMELGTTRSELKARYGAPTIAVESIRDSTLVERYYYLKSDRANVVIATLNNGKLVAAQTTKLWQAQQSFTAEQEREER